MHWRKYNRIIVPIEMSDGGRRVRRYYSSLERCSALIPILSQYFSSAEWHQARKATKFIALNP